MKSSRMLLRSFLVLMFLVGVQQAQAQIFSKDFDFGDKTGWNFEGVGTGSTGYIRTTSGCCAWTAYTGVLNVKAVSTKNWSAVGRQFRYPPIANGRTAASYGYFWAKQPVYLHMEVINPVDWTYIAVTRSWQFPGSQFGNGSRIDFPAFLILPRAVYFRVALMGNNPSVWGAGTTTDQSLDVDNMTFVAK